MGNDSFSLILPLLMAAGLGYYAYRILVLNDISSLKGKDEKHKKFKDEKKYAQGAGKLMIFLAIACVIMPVIMYFSQLAAFAELCVCVVIFGILWKKNYDKYGM